jgi:hypothetical protein
MSLDQDDPADSMALPAPHPASTKAAMIIATICFM